MPDFRWLLPGFLLGFPLDIFVGFLLEFLQGLFPGFHEISVNIFPHTISTGGISIKFLEGTHEATPKVSPENSSEDSIETSHRRRSCLWNISQIFFLDFCRSYCLCFLWSSSHDFFQKLFYKFPGLFLRRFCRYFFEITSRVIPGVRSWDLKCFFLYIFDSCSQSSYRIFSVVYIVILPGITCRISRNPGEISGGILAESSEKLRKDQLGKPREEL